MCNSYSDLFFLLHRSILLYIGPLETAAICNAGPWVLVSTSSVLNTKIMDLVWKFSAGAGFMNRRSSGTPT